ncbi:Si-specific NAD(P)(+) transhydrogenase [Endothiovibrio diazotrophicus]
MEHFDLIVIGSGPAGQKGAIQAAKFGKRVAIVDRRESVGGVCLHTGTIPSKTLREAVLYLSGWDERGVYGEDYRLKRDLTMEDLKQRLQITIRREVEVISNQLARNGVTTIAGAASFLDPHTIRVEGGDGKATDYRADHFLIATGTHPVRPDGVPFDDCRVIDSDGLLHLDRIPHSMTVVGAGVVGIEYAAIFSALDVEVTVIDGRDSILGFMDREVIDEFTHLLRDRGVTLRLGENVKHVAVEGEQVITDLVSGKRIRSDIVLYAAGRAGSVNTLKLDHAGVEFDRRHLIPVNGSYQSNVEHIYAAGDIVGFPSLASTSMEQGRQAVSHAFGHGVRSLPETFPFGIYAVPEMSMVGMTEETLTEKKIPYETGVARLRETARGQIMGLDQGMLKILFALEDRRVLGVHILGEGATELIHIGQAVMALGGTLDYFLNTVFNYPTLAEAYKVAALDAWNRLAP